MPVDYLNESNIKYRLVVDGEDWGLFDGPALELGSESGSNVDPEFGRYSTGGQQLGGEVELSRSWRRSRDRVFAARGDLKRGRAVISIAVLEYDDYDVPVGAEPLFVKVGTLTKVNGPAGNANSNEPATFTVTVEVNA